MGPTIPEHIKENIETSEINEVEETKKEKSNTPMEVTTDEPNTEEEETVKRKRGDRGSKRKTKIEEPKEEDDYYKVGMDSKYDVWVPPQNQSGDGKTSLNEKLGY